MIALQIRDDFEQQKSQLIDEIHKLELEEARLTSVERIHEFARELRMVQPLHPVHILRDEWEKVGKIEKPIRKETTRSENQTSYARAC